jgi:hypothetical protein
MISLLSLLHAWLRPRLLECTRRGVVLPDSVAFVAARPSSCILSYIAGETLDMVTGSVTALMPNVGARSETTHARKVNTGNLRSAQELLLFVFFPLIYSSITEITNDPKTLARPSMSIAPSHDRMTTSKHEPWSVR